MGGKGQRRREKNYNAAHGGGHTRLPPPPDASSLDAMPSKLRKLMSLAGGAARIQQAVKSAERSRGNGSEKETTSGEGRNSTTIMGAKRKRNDQIVMAENTKHGHEAPQTSTHEKQKKKKKNKRNKAEDLRFEEEEKLGAGTRRKERRKQRLEARKNKSKKGMTEEEMDFHGHHETIKFGEVVQAPPKLNAVPKAFKTIQDASQERLRLQAVDSYRKRKGWAARPGVQLPPPVPFL